MSGRRSAPKRSRKAGEAESASKAAKLESSSGGEEEDEENVVDDDDDEVQSRSKGKRIVQAKITPTMVARAATGSAKTKSGGVRQKDFTDREKRSLMEKFLGLPAKALVEAMHIAKRTQPDLDLGQAADAIVLDMDKMSFDTLAALETFIKKMM